MSAELATEEIMLVLASVLLVVGAGVVDRFKQFIARRSRERRRS